MVIFWGGVGSVVDLNTLSLSGHKTEKVGREETQWTWQRRPRQNRQWGIPHQCLKWVNLFFFSSLSFWIFPPGEHPKEEMLTLSPTRWMTALTVCSVHYIPMEQACRIYWLPCILCSLHYTFPHIINASLISQLPLSPVSRWLNTKYFLSISQDRK